MNEPQVMGLLEHIHAADSALGALGAARGSTTDLKEFGRMILREHRALRVESGAVARNQGVTPAPPTVPPDSPPPAIGERLTAGASSAAWDQSYLDYAIAMHESTMENLARALAATKSDSTKKLIRRSVPIIQKHLDKAKSLRRMLQQPDTNARAR